MPGMLAQRDFFTEETWQTFLPRVPPARPLLRLYNRNASARNNPAVNLEGKMPSAAKDSLPVTPARLSLRKSGNT